MRTTFAIALLLLIQAVYSARATAGPLQQQQQQQQQRHLLAETSTPTSLTVSGPDCIEDFYNTTAQHYANDEACSFMINQAFAATAKSGCPQGGAAVGSPLHTCLQKTPGATAAWVDYLTKCPLSNVLMGGKGFSCFPDMSSAADFEAYAKGTAAAAAQQGTRSSSICVRPATGAVVMLQAAAGLLLGAVLL